MMNISGLGQPGLLPISKRGGSAIATDTTQDGLLADLKFGFEFRSKYAINNNLYGNNQHAIQTGAASNVGLLDTFALNCTMTSHIRLDNTTENRFGANNWAIAFLMRVNLFWSGSYTYNVLCANDQPSYRGFNISIQQPTSSPVYTIQVAHTNAGIAEVVTLPSNNQWYLVVVNHNATTKVIDIYLDNANVRSITYVPTLTESTFPFYIGAWYYYGSASASGVTNNTGRLQHFYKWNRILTSTERDWLFSSGSYRFLSK